MTARAELFHGVPTTEVEEILRDAGAALLHRLCCGELATEEDYLFRDAFHCLAQGYHEWHLDQLRGRLRVCREHFEGRGDRDGLRMVAAMEERIA